MEDNLRKMKQKFSIHWKSSKQPRKQRKFIANAPMHIKRKMLTVTLEKELRKKYGRRNIEVRKNDEVKIMSGKFRKKQGKVVSVDAKKIKVYVEGIQITKKEGTKVGVGIHPSNLKIILLNTDDKKRLKQRKEIKGKLKPKNSLLQIDNEKNSKANFLKEETEGVLGKEKTQTKQIKEQNAPKKK